MAGMIQGLGLHVIFERFSRIETTEKVGTAFKKGAV
jgi:hypothetical protein